MTVVSAVRVDAYDPDLLGAAIERHFETLHVAQDLRPGMRVLIKPNMLAARDPAQAVTTHPALLRAIAGWLRAHGVTDITLADSPGGTYSAAILKRHYAACGYDALSDVLTLNLDAGFSQKDGFTLLAPVQQADYLIDCCKLKTHSLTVMSGAVKNLFGCIPGLRKPELHCVHPGVDAFAGMLLNLMDAVKPRLVVMDAIDCMEGNGPGGGTPRFMGMTLASRSACALDDTAARLMGLRPTQVPVLRIARQRGLYQPDDIQQVGDPIAAAQPPFQLPDAVQPPKGFRFSIFANHIFRGAKSYPWVDPAKCVGCGRCAESCPQHIIQLRDRKASMPRKGCISCFCCQEMCPAHAIGVKRGR